MRGQLEAAEKAFLVSLVGVAVDGDNQRMPAVIPVKLTESILLWILVVGIDSALSLRARLDLLRLTLRMGDF